VLDLLYFSQFLQQIIEFTMKEDCGDNWHNSLKIKPPWTLYDAIKCIQLHWIAIFGFVFTNKAQAQTQALMDAVKRYNALSSRATEDSVKQAQQDIIEVAITLLSCGINYSTSATVKEKKVVDCHKILTDYLAKNKQ